MDDGEVAGWMVLLTHVCLHRRSRVVACESAGCVGYYMLKHRGE